ncbi:MAG TPA: hypothetical protein VLW83_15390 [Candidatus Acidoferrales bacterium]|jgi:hypothetical protein|nr:hypothetical protein [Candidatus Acidoferrales bacterium]
MSFTNGILNLTNWTANVILPTLTGLFFAIAILRFARSESYAPSMYGGFLCLMASGLLRAMETFASQRAWSDPDVYWMSLVTLVDWICNVLMPVYAGIQVAAGALRMGIVTRVHPTEGWLRHFVVAGLCLLLSGLVRLAEFFVAQGTAGIR